MDMGFTQHYITMCNNVYVVNYIYDICIYYDGGNMNQNDSKVIRLKLSTVDRLRNIGNRSMTDDMVTVMILDCWDKDQSSHPTTPTLQLQPHNQQEHEQE